MGSCEIPGRDGNCNLSENVICTPMSFFSALGSKDQIKKKSRDDLKNFPQSPRKTVGLHANSATKQTNDPNRESIK